MTDKELKKLSRLELLNLLLEIKKENDELKDKLEKAELDAKISDNINNLLLVTDQMNSAIENVNKIVVTLPDSTEKDDTYKKFIKKMKRRQRHNTHSRVRSINADGEI